MAGLVRFVLTIATDATVSNNIAVNPGASSALSSALADPAGQGRTYNGSLAVTGYGEEARSENG